MITTDRELFPPAKSIYLLSHSIGRMPTTAEQAARDDFVVHWQSDAGDIWDHWLGTLGKFNSALASLFHAPANTFCPQSNISSGLSKVIQSLAPEGTRKVILMCENDFPSAGFVLQQALGMGFELRMLPQDADVQDIETWKTELNEEVHTVFVSHVHYRTSIRAPVKDICALARSQGVLSIIDIAQSAGVVPIDLGDWNADVVIGSCIKWLCGGPGAGFLWINPQLIGQLEPTDVGWFSHTDPFEFDINNFEYAADSTRFWGGTPSVVPFAIAANSIKLITDIGVDKVQSHNQNMIERLIEAIDPKSVVSPSGPRPRGGTLVVQPDDRAGVEAKLNQIGVQYDARALGIRLSPHIYNTSEEIDAVKDCFR